MEDGERRAISFKRITSEVGFMDSILLNYTENLKVNRQKNIHQACPKHKISDASELISGKKKIDFRRNLYQWGFLHINKQFI